MHTAHSLAQADLYELEWDGRPAVLKDFSGRPWWVRRVWARAIVRREVRALDAMRGIEGVPRLYATAGHDAFIMERLNAARLPKKGEPSPPVIFWDHARCLLERLHNHGIGHGDLRRKNMLIGPEGQAYFIDFATALRRKERGWNARLINFLLQRYQRVDRVTFVRIKASYGPDLLEPEERRWLQGEPWYLRLGRLLKKRLYRLRKGKFWRDHARKLWRWMRHIFHHSDS